MSWARQGVLLLNTSLTVEEGRPGSHAKQGWEVLTDDIIESVAMLERSVVFIAEKASAQTGGRRWAGGPSPDPPASRWIVARI